MVECSLTSCMWASFGIGSHTMPGQRHIQPTPTKLGQGICVFRCNLPPSLWQNDRGLLRATAITRGWNGHRIRGSTQSWLWRRKFSRCSCEDSNLQPFDHESSALPTSYPGSQGLVHVLRTKWGPQATEGLVYWNWQRGSTSHWRVSVLKLTEINRQSAA